MNMQPGELAGLVGSFVVWGALLAIFIVACVKGKIRWGGLVGLLWMSVQPLSISLILAFASPLSRLDPGFPTYAVLPLAVSCVVVVLAILTPVVGGRENPLPTASPSWVRWLVLVGGLCLETMGWVGYSFSIYAHRGEPNPTAAIAAWFVFVMLGLVCVYVASRINSPQYPNLMRWFAFFIALFSFAQTTPLSLILIFAYPGTITHGVQFHAALATLAYLAPALMVLALSRDYVPAPAGPTQSQDPMIVITE